MSGSPSLPGVVSDTLIESVHRFVGRSAKYAFISACCLWVWGSTSWLPFYIMAGGVLNALLSKIIKRVVREPRPALASKAGYGMPSSHAQAMCYFLVILYKKRDQLGESDHFRLSALIGITLYVLAASMWRIRSHLHSIAQTVVGAVIGFIFGVIWLQFERNMLITETGRQQEEGTRGGAVCTSSTSLYMYSDLPVPCLIERVSEEYTTGAGPSLGLKILVVIVAITVVFFQERKKKSTTNPDPHHPSLSSIAVGSY